MMHDPIILTAEESRYIRRTIMDLISKPPHWSKGDDLSRRLRESLRLLGDQNIAPIMVCENQPAPDHCSCAMCASVNSIEGG